MLSTLRSTNSTLFPYTTLFRSVRRLADQGVGVVFISHNLNDVFEVADRICALYLGRVAAEVKVGDVSHRDRKSTRLNSSHPSISYAVFCLKKKNNNLQNSHPAQ